MYKKTIAPDSHLPTDPREAINSQRRDFLDFLVKSSTSAVALAATGSLVACGGSGQVSSPAPVPAVPSIFAFGVASGDPLADRVMLWTHAKIPGSTTPVALTWQVATDAAFANVVRTGVVEANEAASFTAKVESTG